MNFSSLITYDRPYLYEWIITHTYKMILEIIDFYIVYSFIIPRFFIKRSNRKFFLITFFYLIFYSFIFAFSLNYLEIILHLIDNYQLFTSYYLVAIYSILLYFFLGGFFRLAMDGYINQQQKTLLEKQNVKSELSLLKSQINPHFLFNTLNTIHSFVKRDPDKAAHSIIKLSGIMRFILSNTNHEKIPLDKEINYLDDYITLETFRLGNPDFVSFIVKGHPDDISIPPMLLIPFVENAFKHGEIKTPLPGIKIILDVTNPKLINFTVENVVSAIGNQNNVQNPGGIGLENVMRRLQLIYPDKYHLTITNKDKQFIVHLSINLL